MVTPEAKRSKVLARGRPQTFSSCVPSGGHFAPILIAGTRLKWKKAQKNAKKSMTSETINRSIPMRRPF